MQLSIVVFGLAVLVAVFVESGDARASPSRDELLDELTEHLLVRYVESRSLDRNVQRINTPERYDDGPEPVRRFFWRRPSSSSTSSSYNGHNSGDISGNYIGGEFNGDIQGSGRK